MQGAGEALRGNINAAIDSAAGDRQGVSRDEAIASKGADEMDHGYHRQHGTGAGVTPVDQTHNRTSTRPGAGSTNCKLYVASNNLKRPLTVRRRPTFYQYRKQA
jgi:hypothetical protein